MKSHLFVLLSFFIGFVNSQNILEEDEAKVIFTQFSDGIPDSILGSFSNFEKNTELGSNVLGLSEKDYIITNADKSTIKLEMDNIGRVVLYSKLFNLNDSILFNPLSKRKGVIKIIPYRDNVVISKLINQIDFEDDIFHQVHFNLNKPEINRIEIEFESDDDVFIVEKLKLVPLTKFGVEFYTEIEKTENSINDLANNLEGNKDILKKNYIVHFGKIRDFYFNLNTIINGKKFEDLSKLKAYSLNPFKNGEFINHYETILEKASAGERANIENLAEELGDQNFGSIAVTLDNLLTGGAFSTIINSIDRLFYKSVKFTQHDLPILNVNSSYFMQDPQRNGKIKLLPIQDEQIISDIQLLTEKNQAYKTYISKIISFMKKDLETMRELDKDILIAKIILDDLEDLIWDIVSDYVKSDRDKIINNSVVDFLIIGSEFKENFNAEVLGVDDFLKARSKSITSTKKFNELSHKYYNLMSRIKTHYDILYKDRPKERKDEFNDLASILPDNIVIDWINRQNDIKSDYIKSEGLQDFLKNATGKNQVLDLQ